jgi:hypothetical protein
MAMPALTSMLFKPLAALASRGAAAAAGTCCCLLRVLMRLQVPLPAPPAHCPPVFVLGGENDKVLDVKAYEELAR